jgi:hypothetical protein
MILTLLWLFWYPILVTPEYMISLSMLGFDLQPNRLLFLILLPVLFFSTVVKKEQKKLDVKRQINDIAFYEFWLILFAIIVSFAQIFNIKEVGIRGMIVNITFLTTFILVYFSAKRFVSDEDLIVLSKGILVLGIISSVVGMYQFFVDPNFFRVGVFRSAFTGYIRGNGLFGSEYDQGLFLVLAMVIAIGILPNNIIKYLIVGVLGCGVFVTSHRMSWLAFCIIFLVFWFISIRRNWWLITLSTLLIMAALIGILLIPSTILFKYPFVYDILNERILVDNITIRMYLNTFAINLISRYPFGMGEFWTNTYNIEAYAWNIPFRSYGALAIHNGFLAAGVKYGFLGLLTFTLFHVSVVFYWLYHQGKPSWQWHVPLFTSLAVVLFNLTQDYSSLSGQICIIWAFILGAYKSVSIIPARAKTHESLGKEFSLSEI